MKDLTKLEQQQQQDAGAGGLFGDLESMMGGADGEEYGDEMQMLQKLLGGAMGPSAGGGMGAAGQGLMQ